MKCPTNGDLRGAHITFDAGGSMLLGEVVDCRRDDTGRLVRLVVRYFNGEPWPLEPMADAVVMLMRDDVVEANPFHTEADCDEACHGCQWCYLETGEPMACGRACKHWRDNSPRDVERLDDEDAQSGAERDGATW